MIDLAALGDIDEKQLLKLPANDLHALIWQAKWRSTARAKQLPPQETWTEWGLCMGRGAGKTLCGAQWLGGEAYFDPEPGPSAVIAPTLNDVRHTCFEGPAGLLSVIPPELVKDYNKTNLIITLLNGASIRGFSAEEPERLRGPQHKRCWGDELASWLKGEDVFDMMMMGLRLGTNPQFLWTTTPKPKELVRKLMAPKPGRFIVRGSTYENRAHLPQSFFDQLVQYEGTQLGRQELEGELIDAEEGGIISRSWLRLWPASKMLPKFEWIIMSLDTAFTEKTFDKKTGADPTACGVFGVFWHEDIRHVMLLDCWDDHLGFPDLVKRVKREMSVAYGDDEDVALIRPLIGSAKPRGSGRKPDILLIEDKGSGISLRQALEREGISAYAYNPGRADKTARLHMVSHIFAQKRVWLPESDRYPGRPRTWTEPLLAQLCSYSGNGSLRHDDYIDVCSQSLRLMLNQNMLDGSRKPKEGREREEPVERKPVTNPYSA